MSTSFGSSNLFGGTAASSANAYSPPLGLRQRHSASVTDGNGNVGASDENTHPNNAPPMKTTAYGKWGAKVPAPPRMSLATAGKFNARRSATHVQQKQQQVPMEGSRGAGESNHQSIVPTNERKEEEDLSLWVIGYGYRNEAHFRALYHRLESCGVINARRGGLACFGEIKTSNNDTSDNGNNWVAVRYESALHAQKALCQHCNFVSLGGSTVVIGVMPLSESDAAAKLGINVSASSSPEIVRLSGSSYNNYRDQRELRTEADIMLYADGQPGSDGVMDDEVKSSLDSLCGKVLAWFFMWDTQTS